MNNVSFVMDKSFPIEKGVWYIRPEQNFEVVKLEHSLTLGENTSYLFIAAIYDYQNEEYTFVPFLLQQGYDETPEDLFKGFEKLFDWCEGDPFKYIEFQRNADKARDELDNKWYAKSNEAYEKYLDTLPNAIRDKWEAQLRQIGEERDETLKALKKGKEDEMAALNERLERQRKGLK